MKRILSFSLKVFVSGGLLYIFLSRMDVQSVLKTLKHTEPSLFILSFFVYLSTVFVSTKRWSFFLPANLKYTKLVSLYFIGSFFNTLLPGLVSGDAVKAFYLYKHTGKGTGGLSLASVFMDRYVGLTALVCIGVIGFMVGYPYIKGTEIVWAILIFVLGFLIGSVILWKINWGKIKAVSSFYIPLMEYKRRKRMILNGLLLSFVVQFAGIICVYILSISIRLDVPIVYFLLFLPLIGVASSVPISIAGLGVREASFVILFTKVGVISAAALSLSLLLFTTMVLVNLIGGIEYLRIGKPPKKEESGV